jgi:hypothetical protein
VCGTGEGSLGRHGTDGQSERRRRDEEEGAQSRCRSRSRSKCRWSGGGGRAATTAATVVGGRWEGARGWARVPQQRLCKRADAGKEQSVQSRTGRGGID